MRRTKVAHLITGLGKGGAETMLYQIIKYQTNRMISHKVISLGMGHYYESLLMYEGADVIRLNIRKNPVKTLLMIPKHLRDCDVLCCWMYISNLLGYIFGRNKVKKIIWCIRHSNLEPNLNSKKTIMINYVCAKISRKVPLIAYNGMRAREAHEIAGYKPEKSVVLNNGCDLELFRNNTDERKKLRLELGLRENAILILSVARDSVIKDHPTFIKAFQMIKKDNPDAVAVMCGFGVDKSNVKICSLCSRLGLNIGTDIILIGFRDDVRQLMCAADLYILHSAGEAFPNTLIQAMASGVLVLSTDVGDVRQIMGNDEWIVETGDFTGLAEKADLMLSLDESWKRKIRRSNREIVERKYDIREVVRNYEKILTL